MGCEEQQSFRVEGKELHFDCGATTNFEYPITEMIDFGEVVAVLLKAPHEGQPYNENVFGVAKDGEIQWQVPRMDWVRGNSPYTAIFKSEKDGLVGLYNYRGTNIFLDPIAGKFIREEIVGW